KFIRIFTLLKKERIESLEAEHNKAPHTRILQKELAKDITIRVHSLADFEKAEKASEILFGKGEDYDANTILQILEGVIPEVTLNPSDYKNTLNVTDLLSIVTNSEIFPSKSEARKMISGGGVYINKSKLSGPEQKVDFELL